MKKFYKVITLCILLIPSLSYADFLGSWYDYPTIFEAIQAGRPDNIKRLVEQGHSIEEINEQGLTPLLFAVYHLVNQEVIESILSCGADIQACDPDGYTPLHLASRFSRIGNRWYLLEVLLRHGADTEARDNSGDTPLINAVFVENSEAIIALLESGADIEAMNNLNFTPLMISVGLNSVKIVNDLIERGAFVDSRDECGLTPLMLASFYGHIAIMKILIKKGANMDAETWSTVHLSGMEFNAGTTALDFAQLVGGRGSVKILLEAGAIDDSRRKDTLSESRENWYEL